VLGLAAAWRRNRQYDEALAMLNRWIADHPRSLLAIDERGKLLIDKGDLDDAAKDFQAIAAAPATAENERIRAAAMRNLGLVYARQGNKGLALKQFEEALLLDPAHCDTHLSAGLIELDQQRYDKAAAHFKEAVRSNPQSMEAHYRLAQTLVKQGHPKQAVANLRDLVAVRADNPIAHFYLAQLLIDQHQLRDGLVELSEAVRLRPDWNLAANELAWYLATTNDLHLRNGARAVPLAEGVCQRTKYSLPSYLDTLAAAYAAAGQFEQAEKTAVRAKEAAIKQGDTNLAARIEQRQRLYAVGQPYRDPLH
jgi:spermidine synthase